jgi:cell division inhibitor SepF
MPFDKLKNFIAPVDDEDEEEEEEKNMEEDLEKTQPISRYEKKNSSVTAVPNNAAMVLFEPRSFEEAEEIARQLKGRKAVVVNLHKLQRDYAQRTIDFLTGVVFALDGTIQKVGHNVILCAPRNVAIDGEIKVDSDDE